MADIKPVLEPAAQEFADSTASPPFLFDLPVEEGRKVVDSVQDGDIPAPAADVTDHLIPGGPLTEVSIKIYRPRGSSGTLPVLLYTHGAGWVFGDAHTHDRLVRELTRGAHVIATVRGDADEARRLGAEEVYDTQAVDLASALHAAHPDGVDAVLDLVSGPDAIRGDAEFIKPGGRLLSTIFAADEEWFADRQITAHNSASSANPLLSPQGLTEVARMLAVGTITARIRATAELAGAGQILDKLRNGGLRGKAVLRVRYQ